MVQECKFDFSDEAPLPSLSYSIPHPHSSSHLFTSQDDFFPPQNGKSFSLVFRAAEVQTAHFCMKYSWLYRAIFEWAREREWDEDGEQLSFWHKLPSRFPWWPHPRSGQLHSSCTCWLFEPEEQTAEKWLISHLLRFQTVCILQFLSSSSPEHSLLSSLGARYSNTAGNVSVAAS